QVDQIHGRPAGPQIRCQHERGGDDRPGTEAGEGAGGEDFDLDSEVLVSAAIAWEISTKVRIGKLPEASAERVFDDRGARERTWRGVIPSPALNRGTKICRPAPRRPSPTARGSARARSNRRGATRRAASPRALRPRVAWVPWEPSTAALRQVAASRPPVGCCAS